MLTYVGVGVGEGEGVRGCDAALFLSSFLCNVLIYEFFILLFE